MRELPFATGNYTTTKNIQANMVAELTTRLGTHRWMRTAFQEVLPDGLAALDDGSPFAVPPRYLREVTATPASCFFCQQTYSPAIAELPCPGVPFSALAPDVRGQVADDDVRVYRDGHGNLGMPFNVDGE